ncbi:uroporphyrinogen-III C-methyltransferase [Methylomagnum ishizawai]|uniref:uroporphyrinogen-III C-methyltransferase n=1 Tax=Methylomagnum ishizawai TaxID=1760988 RepID=UPI001C333DD6|nr:uroporphyrinogen-III C-methyltransferase [Methylomagnum ishizawai]BBL76941.1 hypothetical protein MishRS11D_40390 [Methylomagnum ishizawai]
MSATEPSAGTTGPEAVAKPAAPEARPPKTRSMAWVGYIILLAVLVIAAGGWYLLKELRSRQEGLGGQLSNKDQQLQNVVQQLGALQAEMAALHAQITTAQTQVTTEDSKVERELGEQAARLNDRIDMTRNEIGGAVQAIQRQLNRSRGDLMVADAEYLLSIANQKLHLVGDVKAVLAALEAADQRLHDSGDPAVFKVREALAEEIGLLKKMDAPDVVGLSAQLLALENKAKKLPLFLPHAGTIKEHGGNAPGTAGEHGSALEDIKGLVTVRHANRPIEEILEPAQAEALRQILLLKLETTRAALLRGDETLYKTSLASASDWLKEHFDTGVPATQEVADELNGLAAHDLSVPLPDISQSLTLLRNIERLRLEAEENLGKPKPQAAPEPKPAEPSKPAEDEDEDTDEPGAQP